MSLEIPDSLRAPAQSESVVSSSIGAFWTVLIGAVGLSLTFVFANASPPNATCASNYLPARDLLAQADGADRTGNLTHAIALADNGLKVLGKDYFPPSMRAAVLDDSGQHLSLAYYYRIHRQHRFEFNVARGVLVSRIEVFRRNYHCT